MRTCRGERKIIRLLLQTGLLAGSTRAAECGELALLQTRFSPQNPQAPLHFLDFDNLARNDFLKPTAGGSGSGRLYRNVRL